MSRSTQGPLSGIRVLDATQMLAGPIAGMRLGDMGADVIKIEAPGTGEFNRTHGYGDVTLGGHTTTFLALNRNKRSVAVNLKDDDGREVFYDLVRSADVLIQNFRVGTVERLGIDYETLRAINPKLIYCSITGYGADGPGAGRPGQDLVMQGYSGSMWFVGGKDDPPQPGGVPAIDAMTGYQACIGVLSAVIERGVSGLGQHVEVDMLSVVLDAQIQELVTYLNSGLVPERREEPSAHAWIPAPYGVHRTKDSWLTMAMCPPDVLGEALDNDWLRSLTAYEEGLRNADEIFRVVRAALTERTTEEWIAHFDTYNIWVGPVQTYKDVENDPQVKARGIVTSIEHPEAGTVRTINVPIRLSESPASISAPPPLLGQHTSAILAELGYDAERIAGLASSHSIGVSE